ncbi:hypothetical protein [Nocardia kruczakiae]|uniref:hypothetical protein n=1 Tax=Nocardia kruczakiae TaxID=261477 RepID=UPI0012EDBF31|nr:hypothetical protein [Nocardia kruczakiae]
MRAGSGLGPALSERPDQGVFDRCDSVEPGASAFFAGAVSGIGRDDGPLASDGGSTPDAGGALPTDGAGASVTPLPPPDIADGEFGAASDEAAAG